MSGSDVSEAVQTVIERWGFPTLVALAAMYGIGEAGRILRADVLLPLVEAHKEFLNVVNKSQQEIADSQKEIATAVSEQTKLLYAMQPRAEKTVTVSKLVEEDNEPKN